MGELFVLFIIMLFISILILIGFFLIRKSNLILYLSSIYLMLLGYLQYRSGPSNYILGKLIGIVLILLSILSILIKNKYIKISKFIIGVSIVLSIYTLFFM